MRHNSFGTAVRRVLDYAEIRGRGRMVNKKSLIVTTTVDVSLMVFQFSIPPVAR